MTVAQVLINVGLLTTQKALNIKRPVRMDWDVFIDDDRDYFLN